MKRLFLTAAAIVAFVATAVGQAIPADTAVRTGKLDNGMTYYVRSNAKPAKQAEFYILHHVGAIQEEDNQQGLAHFLRSVWLSTARYRILPEIGRASCRERV